MWKWAGVVILLFALAAGYLQWAGRGGSGRFDSEMRQPAAPAVPGEVIERRQRAQREALARLAGDGSETETEKQILFGDLHVHTTISFDAFMLNLPVLGGQGAHPPADACDFARHCAGLDFWSINDHAENILPEDWRNTVESVRACNALSGDPGSPDQVAFLGWEWTQAGATPADHYGHKNVVLAGLGDDEIPTRPIAASRGGTATRPPNVWVRGAMTFGGERFADLALRWTALTELPVCGDGHARSLPPDCREIAETPAELFRKLDEWGHEALVIPHGTSWGIYTPPAASWDHQLALSQNDSRRQRLIEVYSGHGESEVYRRWRAVTTGEDGEPACPEEQRDYLPMCRRAGQIVKERCLAEGADEAACEERAKVAMEHALRAGVSPQVTVVGTTGADWLDSGQCRDCSEPAFKYRPASSAQYISAITRQDEEGPRRSFRMGFIASSDIHSARPGTGYKETARVAMTDAGKRPPEGGVVGAFFRGEPEPPESRSRTLEEARRKLTGLQLFETERTQSMLYTGGLVAVHSAGRDRRSIWEALNRREVYGTSGPRMLLYFDAIDPATGRALASMGGELELDHDPTFEVRAVGSFEQKPGCPDESVAALGEARVDSLCAGECYNPGDTRRKITHIDVIRIRPQRTEGEDVGRLIQDPWLTLPCEDEGAGCRVRFRDPTFSSSSRDALYYVRAYEAPRPTINGAGVRCSYDDEGRCTEVELCQPGDECLADVAPRAWSSPIWLDQPR